MSTVGGIILRTIHFLSFWQVNEVLRIKIERVPGNFFFKRKKKEEESGGNIYYYYYHYYFQKHT